MRMNKKKKRYLPIALVNRRPADLSRAESVSTACRDTSPPLDYNCRVVSVAEVRLRNYRHQNDKTICNHKTDEKKIN